MKEANFIGQISFSADKEKDFLTQGTACAEAQRCGASPCVWVAKGMTRFGVADIKKRQERFGEPFKCPAKEPGPIVRGISKGF